MELQRSFLLGGILVTAFLLWNAWQADYKKPPQVAQAEQIEKTVSNDVPEMVGAASSAKTQDALPVTPNNQTAYVSERLITVETDVLDIKIDRQGGNLISAKLKDYKQTLDPNSPDIQILNPESAQLYISQSGLASQNGPDIPGEGQAVFNVTQPVFEMNADQEVLMVPMTWSNNGIDVTKTFVFKRGEYLIDVNYDISNNSANTWTGQFYGQFKRAKVEPKKEGFFSFATFNGAAISTPEKRYQKVSYKDMNKEQLNVNTINGWVAMLQHYFVSAWVPNPEENFRIVSYPPQDNIYRVAMVGPTLAVAPGQSLQTGAKFYVGPEITSVLKQIAPGLELTVDYGWFWPISQALFWVLKNLYDILGNWGWAIIFTTLLIKLVFYKLSATSYRSMANMRRVQPKIERIRERCGDDKQKMSQEMLKLYKTEKINPLGGCLPILVQIPVFIALYWVLVESVELHHSPFIFWIHDLSAKDPFYVLPIIMGASMFLQQRLSPAPPDPVQARVLMMMPVVFTVLFLTFPAGLVLYWVVNNLLSIAQQWMIMRKVEKEGAKAK